MRPSKFSEEEIVEALRQVKAGKPAVQVCKALGITQTTFYRWRRKYGHATPGETRQLKSLLEENRKLKLIVANLMLARL